MSNQMRMTGLFSGMDTEAIIQQLVSVKSQKVTALKQDQQKLEWKQNIWKDVNAKVYSLYSGKLSSMRLTGSYAKKKTKVSDSTKATVTAGDTAINGSQSLKINSLAQAGYLTGAKLSPQLVETKETGEDGIEVTTTTEKAWASGSMITDMSDQITEGSIIKLVTNEGTMEQKTTEIEITEGMTIAGLVARMQEAGVNASFDEKNQRFFISSKAAGADNNFTLSGDSLQYLGLDPSKSVDGNKAVKIDGADAEIELNGATFTNNSNTFTINGITITANAITDETLTISTETDYDGIYDMVKEMLTEYNDVINDIYTRYNADSARKYNMLSDEEKEAMTEDQVEKWEDTIKDSLLRRDKDLYTIMNALTSTMSSSYADGSGEKKYLSDYGIMTLNYFEAEEKDRKSYHINGDPDDEQTAEKDDDLRKAITSDPEGTIQFFANLCAGVYDKIGEIMKRSEYRSIYKVYDDKTLQTEYDSYTTKIAEAQKKLEQYEDRYYDKFSAMEVALSKLQSSQNTLAGMLGN